VPPPLAWSVVSLTESSLPLDAKPQVRHALWRLHHAGALQIDALVAEMVEQPLSLAEQHGDKVDLKTLPALGPYSSKSAATAAAQRSKAARSSSEKAFTCSLSTSMVPTTFRPARSATGTMISERVLPKAVR
jgi:hypothetical protein